VTIGSGSRLGPYEITAKLGAGGMGEVHRATDAKLKREVALKVLPTLPLWSRDGRGLFYRNGDRMMRIDIGAGNALAAGTPRLLFTGRFIETLNWNTPYDVAADGRFLRILPAQVERPLDSIDIVLNWATELDSLRGRRK